MLSSSGRVTPIVANCSAADTWTSDKFNFDKTSVAPPSRELLRASAMWAELRGTGWLSEAKWCWLIDRKEDKLEGNEKLTDVGTRMGRQNQALGSHCVPPEMG